MTALMWTGVIAAGWSAVSAPVTVLLGRAIAAADARERIQRYSAGVPSSQSGYTDDEGQADLLLGVVA